MDKAIFLVVFGAAGGFAIGMILGFVRGKFHGWLERDKELKDPMQRIYDDGWIDPKERE